MELEKATEQLTRVEKEQNPYQDKITLLADSVAETDELQNECDFLTKTEKHTGYLIKLLTDPKSFIRKNILDQYIPVVNKKILENSKELGLGHVVKINSDLSVDVMYMNRNVSYFNLSQGERLRLNLAVSSAFRGLMGLLGKTSNIILVDEYLDSALDQEGMHKAFEFIKKQSKSVWIITHKDELYSSVDRVMKVIKQNGFSRIEE
jgi:DNA repair exonuclease SbcCD ATPase subunit